MESQPPEQEEKRRSGGRFDEASRLVRRAVDSLRDMNTDSRRRVWGTALAACAVLAFVLSLMNFIYGSVAGFELLAERSVTVQLSDRAEQDLKPLIDKCARGIHMTVHYGDKDPDVIIDEKEKEAAGASALEVAPALELIAGDIRKTLRQERAYRFMFDRKDQAVARLEKFLQDNYRKRPVNTITMVGDIIPSRHVAERMAEHGVDFPFKRIAPRLQGADIIFGDLECPLSDLQEPPTSGTTFIAPSSTIKGLKLLGLDIVSLANNHSTDFGVQGFMDTVELLQANDIKYVGGGRDYREAHSPVVMESRGVRFAFINYNSIKESIDPGENGPGVAWVNLPPYYEVNPEQIKKIEEDIEKAKKESDFVIACFHWSKEYAYYPSSSMVDLAHTACDAGADMVVGQHPHTIQALEFYDGKFIAYDLGNFIFDQRFSEQVRQGVILKCRFEGNTLTGVEFVPYRINDDCQPVALEGEAGQPLLDRLVKISGWKD